MSGPKKLATADLEEAGNDNAQRFPDGVSFKILLSSKDYVFS